MKDQPDNKYDVGEITKFNETSGSFDFLTEEPDIYTITDLKKVHPKPAD